MRILMAIVELIRSWWQVDRVRASPREGRLLRIRPGTILSVEGTMWEVDRRLSMDDDNCPVVGYACRGKNGSGELWVKVEPGASILLIVHGKQMQLTDEEIEVWAPA